MKVYFSTLAFYLLLGIIPGLFFSPFGAAAIPSEPNLFRLLIAIVLILVPDLLFSVFILFLKRRSILRAITSASQILIQSIIKWTSFVLIALFFVSLIMIIGYPYLNKTEFYNSSNSVCHCSQLVPAWLAGLTFGWLTLNLMYLRLRHKTLNIELH